MRMINEPTAEVSFMSIHIDGVTIRCRDLKASAHFYAELLGFERGQDLGTMLELFAPTGAWPAQADPPPPSRITVMLDQFDESTPGMPGGTYGVVISLSATTSTRSSRSFAALGEACGASRPTSRTVSATPRSSTRTATRCGSPDHSRPTRSDRGRAGMRRRWR